MAQSPSSLLDRVRGLHPSVDEHIVRYRSWLDKAPWILAGLGVVWLLLVAILWIVAGIAIETMDLDPVLLTYAAALAVILVLAYVLVAIVAWVLVKKLKAELMAVTVPDNSAT